MKKDLSETDSFLDRKLPEASKLSKNNVSVLFMLYGILFTVCLITSNLLETKQIAFIGSLTMTGGLLVFPISYIINDCVVEVWGYRRTRLLIWTGFVMNFFVVSMGALVDSIPGAPYWENDAGFHALFGLSAPRIVIASFIAFLTGSFLNAYVMSRMKLTAPPFRPGEETAAGGKRRGTAAFSVRAIMSTIVGESADSVIFFPIAFLGVVPIADLIPMAIGQVVLKTLYEVIALPITIRVVKATKRHEHLDTYDNNISYNIFK